MRRFFLAERENPDDIDLFGNPVYSTKGKRGRPRFEWTKENSSKVSILLGLGWCNSRIAGCILDPRTGKPISEPTLKRHFRSELSERNAMADRMTARRFQRVLKHRWVARAAAFGMPCCQMAPDEKRGPSMTTRRGSCSRRL